MKRILWLAVLWLLVGCGQNGGILPTAVLQPIEQILPTAVSPTMASTAVPTPSQVPTLPPTAQTSPPEVATTAVMAPKVTIVFPMAGENLFVDTGLTIAGEVQPIPTEKGVLVRLLAVGGAELVRETAVVAADGSWTITTTIPPQITGSAQIMAQVEGDLDAVAVQINLLPNKDEDSAWITMNRPTNGSKVVAGYALLFDGEVEQALDGRVTMGIQAADCGETRTMNEIEVQNGRWQGWTVLPPTVDAGAGCAIAFTGERGAEGSREVLMPVTILEETDAQARSLQLGNVGELFLSIGEATYIFGVAIQAPDNQVTIQLWPEGVEEGEPIVQETAVVNSFGYWESDLAIPANTNAQQALLLISMGEDETYREIRQTIFIQHPIATP